MRLADFIEQNTEPILAEWVTFAESNVAAGETMDLVSLRDHAHAMLTDMVADLRTPQTDAQQRAKSRGHADNAESSVDTAAEVHGAGRAQSGFSVVEMVSEYRALRASVVRLWTTNCGELTGSDLEDLMRFNEAIDQSLAEAVARYMQDIDRSREMFIAILSHDLRSPLGAVVTASQFMLDVGALAEPNITLVTTISRSSHRMTHMVSDLLDFTRGRLGSGIPVTRADMDLTEVVREAVEELRGAHPDQVVRLSTAGALRGQWDAARISQVVSNLLGNAVQHGDQGGEIGVTVQGEAEDVVIRINNHGPAIPANAIAGLFSPFKRGGTGPDNGAGAGNLGLGLYIAERIVTAHGGSIDVRSSDAAGTLFTVRLPR